ncbi:DUF4236 domain-containing protein [Sporosarcina luteola]|uniref:DUF4236 domain-containing protein n=1 Tax=Sporosarcina luteola TaxID=582850 RepID=UPI00203C8D0D|nr:DUF4236 domain-containing protein [Sporosarcina luteola]MCM3745109.1 DUF4236 domain-containing protein [Sporosarcina luteola]
MGFRFQKRVKIAPGVRLNISKSGVSTSIGRRGASVTVGKRGVRANVGIPGTGLSYSEQLTKRKKRPQRSSYETIPNIATASPADAKEVEAYNAYVNMLISIHLESEDPVDWEGIIREDLDSFRGNSGPNAEPIRQELAVFKPSWISRLLKRGEAQKRALEKKLADAVKQDQRLLTEKQAKRELAEEVLAGSEEAWLRALKAYHPFDDIEQLGGKIDFKFNNEELTAYFQVGNKEHVPTEVLSLTAKGNLSRKKLGKTNYFTLYQDYVCSCVIRIAREVFAILPAEKVLIHAYDYSQADELPTKGCIISTRIRREELDGMLFDVIDCSETIKTFEHRMNHLKTKGFRLVEEL